MRTRGVGLLKSNLDKNSTLENGDVISVDSLITEYLKLVSITFKFESKPRKANMRGCYNGLTNFDKGTPAIWSELDMSTGTDWALSGVCEIKLRVYFRGTMLSSFFYIFGSTPTDFEENGNGSFG